MVNEIILIFVQRPHTANIWPNIEHGTLSSDWVLETSTEQVRSEHHIWLWCGKTRVIWPDCSSNKQTPVRCNSWFQESAVLYTAAVATCRCALPSQSAGEREVEGVRWRIFNCLTAPLTPFWEDNIKTHVKHTRSGLCKVVKLVVMHSGRRIFLKKGKFLNHQGDYQLLKQENASWI